MKLTKKLEPEILKEYNAYWDNYLKGDVESMANLLDDDYTQIGSAETEVFSNKKAAVQFLYDTIDQVAGKLEMRNRSTRLEQQDKLVLIHELCDIYVFTDDKWVFYSKARASTLMQNKKGIWKIIHQHSSFPDARTGEGENIAIDKVAKENRQLREAIKRRTVELENKNRELEIETALEKVRTIAMGMKKPPDMLDVCKTISLQLQSLGIKEIRNVQTAIFYEQRGTYMNYEYYAKHDKTFITETVFTNNEIHNEFATKMLKGKGETFITHIKGDEVKDWIAYQKTTNVFIDKYLETASSLNYYWFSLGPVALGISTYIPLTEDEINLFKQFLKVFELAYQRYLDIEKAEAQARDAQIELALERVRARTMGMQKSEELKEVIQVVYEQFVHLNILVEHAGFIMDYKARDDMHIWLADKHEVPFQITIPYFDSPHWNSFIEAKEKGMDFFANHLTFEEKNKFYKELFKLFPVPDEAKEYYFSCPGLAGSTVLLENVGLYIENFSGIPYTDEENNTLMRFGKVFQQTYTRFIDLQKAEAQTKEAQIELALERVRARTMAMQRSEELSETSLVLFQQFAELGITPNRFFIGVVNEEEGIFDLWITEWGGSMYSQTFKGNLEEPLMLKKVYDAWRANDKAIVVDINGENFVKWNEYLKSIDFPVASRKFVSRVVNSCAIFSKGFIAITTPEIPAAETAQLLTRFASVFDGTYTRFFDLQKAEAQAREAKIEASLEKVRSKTMAMQSSNELADTAAVVFQQLNSLGIEPNRIYITIIKDEAGICEFWITDEDGSKVSSGFKANLNENDSFKKMYAGWKENKKSITIDMQGEELKEYFRHLSKLDVPFKSGLSQKRRMQYIAYFSKGFIGVASPDETKPETLQLLERFAAVFNLTYTRFNDLKQAEAQNKIIRAENDRKTKELEEARQLQLSLLPKALPKLPHLDIAVYMKTATEVGGDYYDFNVQENGVLNIGFGDATGHGLQAGTMITLMKGFFTSDVARFSPQKFLEHCNGIIRDIKLGRILMSFSHLRFENKRLLISSAGMPPIYYHNKKNNRAEEIIIQGLPLGAMGSASYKLVEKELNDGDTILLLTDGLPEQMNKGKVIFGYSRVLKYFGEIVENTPDKIINTLVKKADEWMNETKQADDMTFVVIRVK